ncbi:MAG TPA: ethanolamine ammonia-lyase subunit EutC [Cytophagaceae bacterium]|jgi:ethanolamine ammonia-lyase small subunit|nr:ethanolamine ammonia-lyase subunit EutC [Cytophagaceae bacterium]
MSPEDNFIESDSWEFLRKHTAARIALGHVGVSLPTKELLAFRLAHARARDAVYSELEIEKISIQLSENGLDYLSIKSSAVARNDYLQNPNSGKKLNSESAKKLKQLSSYDLCFIIGDGLSAAAVNEHAVELIKILVAKFKKLNWSIAPVILAEQARVALSDEIGVLIKAEIVVMLLGERPGLSSSDSMGAYITYHPEQGLTDERRNCVSNIRPEGLSYPFAAEKLFYLLTEMKTKKISGVHLKDKQDDFLLE